MNCRPSRPLPLTNRQIAIACAIANSENVKSIAASLGISIKTVWYHTNQLRQTLGLKTYQQITLWALSRKLINNPYN